MKIKKYIILFIISIILFTNFNVYSRLQKEWLGSEVIYIEARKYFVACMMVDVYRHLLNKIFDIDDLFMKPLNYLVYKLYNKGVLFLPKDDAEEAFWRYWLFVSYYTKKNLLSKDNSKDILDDTYNIIQSLSTKPIKDRNIKKYIPKIFVLVSSFYVDKQIGYFPIKYHPNDVDGVKNILPLYYDKDKFNRNYDLLKWILRLEDDISVFKEIENDSVLLIIYYGSIIKASEFIIVGDILHNSDICKGSYKNIYLKYRKTTLMAIKYSKIYTKNDNVNILYERIFDNQFSKLIIYLISSSCNIEKDSAYPDDRWINKNREGINNIINSIRYKTKGHGK